jgi:hypothetical protein
MFRRRPSPSMVVALIALFVTLGGTAWAAVTITGRNVRNGSLTGADIRNNSLNGRQIRESRLGKVPRASRADRVGGRSVEQVTTRGYFASQDGSKTFGATETVIGSLSLPAGGYVLQSKITLSNESGNTSKVFCRLIAGQIFDESIAFLATGNSFANTQTIPNVAVASMGSAFNAELRCRSEGGGGLSLGQSGLQRALNTKITAIRTDSLDLRSFR